MINGEGNCRDDPDCAQGLKYFQRDRWEKVAIDLAGNGRKGWNYCGIKEFCPEFDVSFGIDRTHLNATVEIEDKYKTSKDNVRDLRTTSVATGEKDHRSECFRRKWEK